MVFEPPSNLQGEWRSPTRWPRHALDLINGLLWQFPAHRFGDNESKAVIRTTHWSPGIVDVAGQACELAQTPNYFGRAFAWRDVLEGLPVLIAVLITLDAISIASCFIALQTV